MIAENVNEYTEEMEVEIKQLKKSDAEIYRSVISDATHQAYVEERWVVQALNEGGHNCTQVDLGQLLAWVKKNKPEMLEKL